LIFSPVTRQSRLKIAKDIEVEPRCSHFGLKTETSFDFAADPKQSNCRRLIFITTFHVLTCFGLEISKENAR